MKTLTRTVLTMMFAALLAAPLLAAEGDQAKKKRAKGKKRPAPTIVRLPKGIELSDEQKAKVKVLESEFRGKLTEVRAKFAGVLTQEQRQARSKAFREAIKAGKKGQEARKAANEASKLTEEQTKKLAAIQKEQRVINIAIRKKLNEILTPEQRAKANPKRKTGKKKKKPAKDTDK